MQNSTNMRILELLQFLYERTDENHPATVSDIIAHLNEKGIQAVRQTVYADTNALIDAGIDIVVVKSTQNQYFMGSRLFEYALEWKNDHYYLIGFSHKHQRMAHFRVDRLSGIKILPSGFTPDEDFDVAGYTNKIVDMFAADRTVSVELLCENKLMKTIIDHYGEAVPTRTYDEEHFTANIEVDPSGTFYGWVFKFMGGIQIIAPHECVEEMKRIAHRFL